MAEAASEESRRREGRGWLSSIDLLPEEAEGDVVWALEQLRENKLPQVVILVGLNDRLVAKGITPISKSSWSRYAVRKAIQFRKLDETRRMAGELVESLGAEGPDEVTVAVAEMLKVAVFQKLEDGTNLTEKGIMELSRALGSAVSAQKASAEYRRKLQEEIKGKVDKALERAGDKGGLGQAGADGEAVIKRIREEVYGIFQA